MTALLKPTLALSKLRILRDGRSAYEADFHDGVNIISGQNASGKSTIVDFIFYGLGGENVPWKNEALLCSEVILEVEINGSIVTFRRSINSESKSPLSIYWGNYEDAIVAGVASWETYPYQRSSKESFSQVIFRLLGMPELRGEGAANITMHQILRLLYVDQRTPHDKIFRSESFDTILTRETVGNYLCGVYSDKLYDAQLQLKTVDAQLARSVSDLRNLFSILGKSGQSGSTTDFLRAEEASIRDEVRAVQDKLVGLSSAATADSAGSGGAARVSVLRRELSDAQGKFAQTQSELSDLRLEIDDSRLFIEELDRRLESLDDSESTRSYLGALKFDFCPCCLEKIDDVSSPLTCALCKAPTMGRFGESQILRMKNELALQRRESSGLLEVRLEKISTLSRDLPALENLLNHLEQRYALEAREWVSPFEREARSLSSRLGELNQQLLQNKEYEKLAMVIEDLQSKRAALEAQKSSLEDVVLLAQNQNENTKRVARLAIADDLIYLLRNDLPRQEEFISAAAVDWSFSQDEVSVNGHTQFSESSMVILKHSYHLALLMASTKHEFFRIPRFMMLDGIEDGGQETLRSHALQELIVKVSGDLPAKHQIIFATSQIAPALAGSVYVVGKTSTMADKTLLIS